MSQLTPKDHQSLTEARDLLETPSLAARMTHLVGAPLENALKKLPAATHAKIGEVTRLSLEKVAQGAGLTLDPTSKAPSRRGIHKALVAASGAWGGAMGIAGLALELPVSTGLIFRSILEIAREQGEDITEVQTLVEALTVFALGGSSTLDDGTETGYFAIRGVLAKAVTEATAHVAARGLSREAAPPLIRLLTQIASRFSVQVTEKSAAQLVPIIGAVGGASINVAFMTHFQDMARGHFVLRRLERRYGERVIQELYQSPEDNSPGTTKGLQRV